MSWSTLADVKNYFTSKLASIKTAITAKGGTQPTGYGDIETCIASIPSGITPTGTKEITENGTHDVTDYASADVNVSPTLQFKFITENGNYSPDEGFDGFSDVEVSVYPALEDVTITENGEYTSTEYDGYGTVTVDVQGGGGTLKDISPVTVNGTYEVYDDLEIYDSMTLTGNAYANTDFTPKDNSFETVEACFVVTTTVSGSAKNRIFGTQGTVSGQGYNKYTLAQTATGFSFITSKQNYTVALTPVVGTEYLCKFDGGTFTVNGVASTTSTEVGCISPVTLDVFACHLSDDSHEDKFTGTFKYLKISSGYWFVPAKLDGNPAVCNKITGKTYLVTGTGVTMGTKLSEEDYDGFAHPIVVNVRGGSKYGATIESFFTDLTGAGVYDPPTETGTEEMVFTGLKKLANSSGYAYIFAYKFAYCNPKKVSFPDLTNIGCQSAFQYAFYHSLVEEVSFPALTTFSLSHAFYYGFYYATKLKKASFNAITDASKTYMFYYAFSYAGESNADPLEVEFPNLTTISGTNVFANAFNHAYLGHGVLHPFPALTTITAAGILTSSFAYTNCIRYVLDKIGVLNKTNMFTNAWNYCFPSGGGSYDETYGIMFPMLTTIGISSGASSYTVFKSCCYNSNNRMNAYFSSLTAIYNNNTTASNSHFGTCGLVKVFLPKVTNMGTKGEYAFYNSSTITEFHFGIENQATVEALTGYSSKFGATNATMCFDLANHLTINGVTYDRDGSTDDYDNWYFGFTDGTDTYYIDNYYGNVGDVVYTKSGDTYTATAYTVTGVA